jgi:hypothetical protein
VEPFAKLEFLFKIKACEKFYHRRPVGSALIVVPKGSVDSENKKTRYPYG